MVMSKLTQKYLKLAPRLTAARWLQLGIVDKLRATDKKKKRKMKKEEKMLANMSLPQ